MDVLFVIFMGAAFINNILLTQFLGVCPMLGVSKKSDQALGMSAAVIFVILISSLVTKSVYDFILAPLNIQYMQIIAFVIIIASLVQFVEMVMKKYMVGLYKSLGVFLPLITTNCAVLGTANAIVSAEYSFVETTIYALGISIGFAIVMYIFSTLRERMSTSPITRSFKDNPIALITAAIMALAFFGLGGLV